MPTEVSNENNRTIWLKKTLAKIPAGSRILDAGAGEQQFKQFCPHLDYVAQDFGQYDGSGDGVGLHVANWKQVELDLVCDIINIPEPDSSFDAIMCIEVFEHLPNPLAAIHEFSRLLKKGGYLIITAPFCSLTHFAPYHYSTGFNRYYYKTHLENNGFEIVELKSNGNFFKFLEQEICRLSSVIKRYTSDHSSRFENFALRIVIKMLQRFASKDQGSDEILCFGYHILAKKE